MLQRLYVVPLIAGVKKSFFKHREQEHTMADVIQVDWKMPESKYFLVLCR